MKVKRRIKIRTNQYAIGDQMTIKLSGIGKFTATVQKVYNDGSALCFFDDCVARKPMNRNGKNEGGFYEADLCEWMNTELIKAFPQKILKMMKPVHGNMMLRIPTRGEVFGKDDYSQHYEEEDIKQLPLMKKRRNRICSDLEDDYCWYWLLNRDVVSSTYFALVDTDGYASAANASTSLGVRPAFIINNL